jgi:hypothetical protein
MDHLSSDLEMRLLALRESSIPAGENERRTQSLERVKLTRDEQLEYGRQCADAQSTIKQLVADLSSIKKQLQARIEGQAAIIDQKSEAIRSGYEQRMVECVDVLEYPRLGRKTTFRLDTLEAVNEALMTETEMQRMLKLEDDRAAQAQKAGDCGSGGATSGGSARRRSRGRVRADSCGATRSQVAPDAEAGRVHLTFRRKPGPCEQPRNENSPAPAAVNTKETS